MRSLNDFVFVRAFAWQVATAEGDVKLIAVLRASAASLLAGYQADRKHYEQKRTTTAEEIKQRKQEAANELKAKQAELARAREDNVKELEAQRARLHADIAAERKSFTDKAMSLNDRNTEVSGGWFIFRASISKLLPLFGSVFIYVCRCYCRLVFIAFI